MRASKNELQVTRMETRSCFKLLLENCGKHQAPSTNEQQNIPQVRTCLCDPVLEVSFPVNSKAVQKQNGHSRSEARFKLEINLEITTNDNLHREQQGYKSITCFRKASQ